MTENEKEIRILRHMKNLITVRTFEEEALKTAIQALEEIQQYRAIGTIEEFKALKEKNEPKKILYRKQSYGTPWLCPYCEADQIKVEFFSEDGSEPKEKYTFCWQCGTRIDWSE